MADVEIKSLRIAAEMDASKMVAGAQQIATATKTAATSTAQLGATITQTDTKISQAGDVLVRLSRLYVDGYASAQRFNSALTQLATGMANGKIKMEQSGAILDGIYKKFGLMGDAAAFAARGQTALAQAISEANAKLAQQQGLNPANGNADTTRLARMDELRTKFDAQFASAQRLGAELNDLAEAERLGVQVTGGYAAALDAVILKHDAVAAAAARQAAEYKQLAAAGRDAFAADRAQGNFNSTLGVTPAVTGTARASAAVFESELGRLEQIAQLKAQQAGATFGQQLDASLIAGTAKSARDAASVFTAEMDRIDEIAKLKAAQAGAAFQSSLNASFGIGAAPNSARASASVFEQAGREADAFAAKVAALRAEINPTAAAQDRLNAELAEYSAMAAKGAINAEELARAQALARGRAANNNSQGGLARFGTLNATSQFQDIAITAAMGQSPLTIALQQGTQLGMAMETQLAGQAAGVGNIFKGIGGALMGLVTTTNLWAIGLTAAAAVAIQFGSKLLGGFKSAEDQAREFNKLLSEQKEILQSLGPIYEEMARHQSGQFQAPGVGRLVLQQNLEDAQKASEEQARAALKEMQGTGGTFLSLFRMLPNGAQNFLGRNQSATEFDRIVDMASKSEMSINDARTALQRFGSEHPDFNYIINRFLEMSEAAAKTEREVGGLVGILDRFAEIRLPEASSYPRNAAEEQARADAFRSRELATINRQQTGFAADILGVGARSPEERAAAARAAAAAQEGTGTGAANANRIELAGKRALIEAEQQLKDAQDERRRSLDQTLESAKLDVELVGKTTAQIEGLRIAAQLEAQVREQAALNHGAADEAEIARIKKKAEEIGKLKAQEQIAQRIQQQTDDLELQRGEISAVGLNKLAHDALIATLKTEMEIRKAGIDPLSAQAEALRANTDAANANAEALAKASLAADLQFERRQIGRDDQDQAIASRLKAAGLPDDLNSTEAALIRANMRLSEARDDFKGFFHDVLDGFRDGKSAVEAFTNALSNLAGKLADRFLDRAMDELFGMITGTGGSSSTGGGEGLLGKLFGGLFGGSAANTNIAPLAANLAKSVGGPFTQQASQNILDQLGSGGFAASAAASLPAAGFTKMGIPLSQISIGNLTAQLDTRYAERFQGLLNELQQRGYPISSLGEGGYSFRNVAGTGTLSNHAYGQALDINPAQNPQGYGAHGNWSQYGIDPNALAKKYGLEYGGMWRKADTMHFQVPGGGRVPYRGGSGANALVGGPDGDRLTGQGDRLPNIAMTERDAQRLERQQGMYQAGDLRGGSGTNSLSGASESLDKLKGASDLASESLSKAGLAGFDTVKGLTDAAGGLTKFGGLLSSFMAPGGGSGTGWFQNLAGLFGGASGAVNSMLGISPGATSAILAGGALGPAGLYHDGGIAGMPSSMRGVHPSVFIGARRYHMGGLAGDEVPAILRRGEPVFKSMDHARQMFAPANQNMDAITAAVAKRLNVNVKNINVYDRSVVGDYLQTDEGEEAHVNVMRKTGTARGL